jgi:hypothetical protein
VIKRKEKKRKENKKKKHNSLQNHSQAPPPLKISVLAGLQHPARQVQTPINEI